MEKLFAYCIGAFIKNLTPESGTIKRMSCISTRIGTCNSITFPGYHPNRIDILPLLSINPHNSCQRPMFSGRPENFSMVTPV